MGRGKVEIKEIADRNARIVTFSKRRSGLFKKAGELATLCGAEVAVVSYSPAGKLFSFGQPSLEAVVDKFLNESERRASGEGSSAGSDPKNDVEALSKKLKRLKDEIKAEKVKKEKLKTVDTAPIDVKNLGIDELLRLKARMEMIRDAANNRFCELESAAAESLVMIKHSAKGGSDEIHEAENAGVGRGKVHRRWSFMRRTIERLSSRVNSRPISDREDDEEEVEDAREK